MSALFKNISFDAVLSFFCFVFVVAHCCETITQHISIHTSESDWTALWWNCLSLVGRSGDMKGQKRSENVLLSTLLKRGTLLNVTFLLFLSWSTSEYLSDISLMKVVAFVLWHIMCFPEFNRSSQYFPIRSQFLYICNDLTKLDCTTCGLTTS